MKTIIQTTEDGSHTLYVPGIDEHYHSTHGAIQESMHVYIEAGLCHCRAPEINLMEIGFGSGLNAFLTLLEAEKLQKMIHYTTLELYPLPVVDAEKLNYVVRRMLQTAGYIVERLPGPSGKREILRATKVA